MHRGRDGSPAGPDKPAKTEVWMILLTLTQLGQNWGRKIAKAEFTRPPSFSVSQMKVKVWEAFSGPGSRALPAEIMRQLPFSGPVGPPRLRIVDSGVRIEKESPKIRNPQFEIRNSIGRCFLRATPLTPVHDKGYLQREGGGEGLNPEKG